MARQVGEEQLAEACAGLRWELSARPGFSFILYGEGSEEGHERYESLVHLDELDRWVVVEDEGVRHIQAYAHTNDTRAALWFYDADRMVQFFERYDLDGDLTTLETAT